MLSNNCNILSCGLVLEYFHWEIGPQIKEFEGVCVIRVVTQIFKSSLFEGVPKCV